MPARNDSNSPLRLPAVLAIGFTGHRTLADEEKSRALIRNFLEQKKASVQANIYGISSAAAGGDLLFAESCLELGIPLRILLPVSAEIFRNDFNPSTWSRAEKILAHAISVEVTGDNQLREERYYECGIETVQQCQILLALWDGEPSRGVGGTEEIVSFARNIGRPVFWFHSETGALTVFHEDDADNIQHDPELEFLTSLPDPALPQAPSTPTALAEAWFRKLDNAASRFAPQTRRLTAIPIVFTATAALLSSAATLGSAAPAWLGASAIMGIIAAALPAALRLNRRQQLWARTRTAAEICRSVLALWSTPGLYEVIGPEIIPELSGMLTSLNFLKIQDSARTRISLDQFKRLYRRDRVAGQISYLSEHSALAAREGRAFGIATWISAGIGIAIAATLFSSKFGLFGLHPFAYSKWLTLCVSLFFQAATVAGALIVVNDCNRRQQRYKELENWLRDWDAQLEALRTWPTVLNIATRVEKALLVELLEWRSLVRNAKLSGK